MKSNSIPIVFCIDNNLVLQACVAIYSIYKNKLNDTQYTFYVLLSEEISEENEQRIHRLKKCEDMQINVYIVGDKSVNSAKVGVGGSYLTQAAYLRLFVADYFKDLEKCIYLDADVLVVADLKELYDFELGDNYMAGVQDYILSVRNIEDRKRYLDIESLENYINSGVLLMNLNRIRRDRLYNRFLVEIKKGYPFSDQDVINKVCYGFIKKIPLKYNLINRYMYNDRIFVENIYEKEEIEEAINQPCIIHFVGKYKPWVFNRSKGSDLWMSYAEKILCKEDIELLESNINTYISQMNLTKLEQWDANKVVIWGYSEVGKKLCIALQDAGKQVVAFGDNNEALHKQCFNGVNVISSEDVRDMDFDLIVIASQGAAIIIENQLIELGISEKKIISYKSKNEFYYIALRKEFYDEELQEIYFREYGEKNDQINVSNYLDVFGAKKERLEKKYKFSLWLN